MKIGTQQNKVNPQYTGQGDVERALLKSAKAAQIYQIIEKYHKVRLDNLFVSNVLREFRFMRM